MKSGRIAPQVFGALVFVSELILGFNSSAQNQFKGFQNLFTPPLNYVVHRANTPLIIDGDINDEAWQQASWTSNFVDIEGSIKPKPAYNTQVKMLWNDSCLYIAAHITEPNVWATLHNRDQIIFNDNDFEVFINPDNSTHHYYEAEFNALNTIFDLYMSKPYRNGGSALIPFNLSGLHSAVKINGTLNNASDTDEGWTIEIAIPFRDLSLGNDVQVPTDGITWRINFSRVEWDTKIVDGRYVREVNNKGHRLPEHNWVWSPQGVVNMHYPERWGYLQFTKKDVNVEFKLPSEDSQRKYLWLIYYKQKEWFEKYHHYVRTLKQLGIASRKVSIGNKANLLSMEASKHEFMIFIQCKGEAEFSIDQDGFVQKVNTMNK